MSFILELNFKIRCQRARLSQNQLGELDVMNIRNGKMKTISAGDLYNES